MNWHIEQGDCLDILRTLPDDAVDALVTDPPAGISFMGKDWDGDKGGRDQWITWLCERMREVWRVLKPGAHGLVWALPRTSHWTATSLEDAGFEIRDVGVHLFGTGFPKSKSLLKPAAEHWILVRKPGPLAPLNIDECRIGTEVRINPPAGNKAGGNSYGMSVSGMPADAAPRECIGRWPANVTLDEEAAAMLDAQSGHLKAGGKISGQEPSAPTSNTYGEFARTSWEPHGDSGGASRFFYCAKASKRDKGADNKHPTVKNTALMEWLIRLITPPGGLVLDPFAGSGSTGVAAVRGGWEFYGIEREPEYAATAKVAPILCRHRDTVTT